jgi:hypothetical protein
MSNKRVPKHVAKELIKFAKSIEVNANFWDPQGKSAFEFYRQISSPHLKKINSSFSTNLKELGEGSKAGIKAEFIDGSIWETPTDDLDCMQLRNMFFEKAEFAENNLEAKVGGKK